MASEPDDLYENARANKQIYDKITSFPDAKLGFVVYRCTYSSNADWEQFMAYLDARMLYKLERGGIADLAHRLDWCVQQDPRLEDASEEEVRRCVEYTLSSCVHDEVDFALMYVKTLPHMASGDR